MNTIRMYPSSINDRYLDDVVETLRDGGIIIYPTDTIYAIGCNALDNQAIEKICRVKSIDPRRQSLSIVCCDLSQASEYARIDNSAYKVLNRNLPGPFTFLLPASHKLPKVFKGRKTVGVRVPDNAIAQAITRRLGNPILSSTVVLPEGSDPAYLANPMEIGINYQGLADILIDGGDGQTAGSAVIDLTDSSAPEIIREGPVELQ